MTLYHAMVRETTGRWYQCLNPHRDDGRWEADGPSAAEQLVREHELQYRIFAATATILVVPQHRWHTFPTDLRQPYG